MNQGLLQIPAKMPGFFLIFTRVFIVLAGFTSSLLFQSCYLMKQAGALGTLRASARPVDEVLKDPKTTADLKVFLERVSDIRQYGKNTLGLSDTENFTSIIVMEKDHVVRVVNAASPLSFRRHTWWFPFFGDSPYLGFFEDKDADAEADKLRKQGLDVFVRNVEAFSGLGIFSDPLYSFMEHYGPYSMANLILHEQTHATLWIPNNFDFNERMATFVGDHAALDYMRDRNVGAPDYQEKLQLYNQDLVTFYQQISELRSSLNKVYTSSDLDSVKLKKKAQIINDWKIHFKTEYTTLFKTESFKEIAELEDINNAWIDLYHTYSGDMEIFEKAYIASGRSVKAFLKALRDHGVQRRPPMDVVRELAEGKLTH